MGPPATALYGFHSTARGGEQANSYQTPRGWHHVCEKLGAGQKPNTIIFRRRVTPWKYTAELHQYPEKTGSSPASCGCAVMNRPEPGGQCR
jgi:hypothetical protein